MQSSLETLRSLARSQDAVEAAARGSDGRPHKVLAAGRLLLQLAEHEHDALTPILPLLDPAVRAALETDHQELGEDLGLLDWLAATNPNSHDVTVLAASLAHRIRDHVARDRRLLERAMSLVGR